MWLVLITNSHDKKDLLFIFFNFTVEQGFKNRNFSFACELTDTLS